MSGVIFRITTYHKHKSWHRVPTENPTPSPAADPYLINEHTILCEFLDIVNIVSDDYDDEVSSVNSVCSTCKHPPQKKGEDLKRCSRCHITRYYSEQYQRKDWDFHRFACSLVAKRSDTVKA